MLPTSQVVAEAGSAFGNVQAIDFHPPGGAPLLRCAGHLTQQPTYPTLPNPTRWPSSSGPPMLTPGPRACWVLLNDCSFMRSGDAMVGAMFSEPEWVDYPCSPLPLQPHTPAAALPLQPLTPAASYPACGPRAACRVAGACAADQG